MPTMPTVLPLMLLPEQLQPVRRRCRAAGRGWLTPIRLVSASMSAMACSATGSLLVPDWLQHDHAGIGAGVDVDHVEAGAGGAERQHARAAGEQAGGAEPGLTQLGAGADLVAAGDV